MDYQSGGNNLLFSEDASGAVLKSAAGYQNGGTDFTYNGMDYQLAGSIETGFGTFNLQLNMSNYLNYDYELTYGTGRVG